MRQAFGSVCRVLAPAPRGAQAAVRAGAWHRLAWERDSVARDRKRRVLVCGAPGFIARNVAEALARRDDLEVLGTRFPSRPYDHRGISFTRCDLRQPAEVERVL